MTVVGMVVESFHQQLTGFWSPDFWASDADNPSSRPPIPLKSDIDRCAETSRKQSCATMGYAVGIQ